MGVFVNYLSIPFSGLTNNPTTILDTSVIPNTLLINGIMVCNRGAAPMRFNLQKTRITTPMAVPPLMPVPTSITIFYLNQFEIQPYQTIDIATQLGFKIFLESNIATPTVSAVSDSLVCFSNGYTQQFDCEVSYTQLNELPFA